MRYLKEKRARYAGLLPRGAAYLIDCGVAFGFYALTQLLLFRPLLLGLGGGEAWLHDGMQMQLYTLVTISLPVWMYFSLAESSRWKATIGKKLVSLKVVDESTGTALPFGRAFRRTIIKLLPWEIAHLTNNLPQPLYFSNEPEFRLGFLAVGLLMIIYVAWIRLDGKRQGPHDRLARSVVTHTPGSG